MLISHWRTIRNPPPERRVVLLNTHSNKQSVCFLYEPFKRSQNFTPAWTLSTWRGETHLDGSPVTTPRPPGTETNGEQLFVSLDWLYENTWGFCCLFVFLLSFFCTHNQNQSRTWISMRAAAGLWFLFFFFSNIRVLLCVVLWWTRSLRLFRGPRALPLPPQGGVRGRGGRTTVASSKFC